MSSPRARPFHSVLLRGYDIAHRIVQNAQTKERISDTLKFYTSMHQASVEGEAYFS